MKVITIRQPWAWAVIFGGKDVENRVQNLAKNCVGETLAIHAGLTMSLEGFVNPLLRKQWEKFRREVPEPNIVGPLRVNSLHLEVGRIIGVVDVVGTHHSASCHRRINDGTLTDYERIVIDRRCSPWADADAWHIELANPRPLTVPLVHRGDQGIRTLPASVEREVRARLAA